MRRFQMLINRFAMASSFLLLILFFQNCDKSFQVSEFASETIEPLSIPSLSFVQTPLSLTNKATFDIEFKTDVDRRVTIKSLKCQIDSLPPTDCLNGKIALIALSDGDHTVTIDGVDSRGQRTDQLVALFRVDTKAPSIVLTEKPAAVIGSVSAVFGFSATDQLSEVNLIECALDVATFAKCDSNLAHNLRSLSPGRHIFRVRARDTAGNLSEETPYQWVIDLTAPTITIVKPANFIGSKSISIAFSGTDDGLPITNFECQLDGEGFSPCSSPKTYTGTLLEGPRTFAVQGKDTAGNLSSPQTVTFTVDTTAPAKPIITTAAVSPTKMNTPTLAFSSTDVGSGVASYSCSLDADAFSPCTSPFTFARILDGSRTLHVRSKDNVGNESVVADLALTIDTSAPVITLSKFPADVGTETNVVFDFAASDATSGIKSLECQINNVGYSACATSKSYSVGIGTHVFMIRAIDLAGNVANTSKSFTVTSQPVPTPTPPAGVPTWTVPTITLTEGGMSEFALSSTLPAGVALGGTFSLELSSAPLPKGVTLRPDGLLSVGTAVAGDTAGVIFTYLEP